ncbi:MAG: divergent PAP2 family protein [Peptococcaceae bacterium]|nr:divergent PAP2 family protein [Peptococcaceae bacterium]
MELIANRLLQTAVGALLLAQILKVVFVLVVRKHMDLSLMLSSGGMPSSHSALVTALAVGIGRLYGFQSASFAIATVFSLIVMYDAAGVRRAAGKQAEVLNQIVEQIYPNDGFRRERLKELIGHTPIEVFGGCLLGVIFALLY